MFFSIFHCIALASSSYWKNNKKFIFWCRRKHKFFWANWSRVKILSRLINGIFQSYRSCLILCTIKQNEYTCFRYIFSEKILKSLKYSKGSWIFSFTFLHNKIENFFKLFESENFGFSYLVINNLWKYLLKNTKFSKHAFPCSKTDSWGPQMSFFVYFYVVMLTLFIGVDFLSLTRFNLNFSFTGFHRTLIFKTISFVIEFKVSFSISGCQDVIPCIVQIYRGFIKFYFVTK